MSNYDLYLDFKKYTQQWPGTEHAGTTLSTPTFSSTISDRTLRLNWPVLGWAPKEVFLKEKEKKENHLARETMRQVLMSNFLLFVSKQAILVQNRLFGQNLNYI